MPGFFEALENIKKPKEKVHTVTIQGKSVVVTWRKIRSSERRGFIHMENG